MAKRSRSAARPGQIRPTRRPARPAGRSGTAAATDVLRSAPTGLDDASMAQVDLDLPVEERAVARDRRERGRADAAVPARGRGLLPSSLLAARAAQEYDYVIRDVRRIGLVGGGLVVLLAILYVLIEVVHIVTI